MKVFWGLVVHYPRIMKFTKATEVHRNLVIQAHQFWGIVEVFQVFMVVQHLDKALHKFPIDIHRIFVEPIVEVISQLLVLSLPIARISQIVFVEGVLEDILRLHHEHRPSSHLSNQLLQISPPIQHLNTFISPHIFHILSSLSPDPQTSFEPFTPSYNNPILLYSFLIRIRKVQSSSNCDKWKVQLIFAFRLVIKTSLLKYDNFYS